MYLAWEKEINRKVSIGQETSNRTESRVLLLTKRDLLDGRGEQRAKYALFGVLAKRKSPAQPQGQAGESRLFHGFYVRNVLWVKASSVSEDYKIKAKCS